MCSPKLQMKHEFWFVRGLGKLKISFLDKYPISSGQLLI